LVVERGLAKKREQRWTNMTELGEALALWLYEHGIKEDLSGNSIRAVWLDGALSGVRADLPQSGPPGPASVPPPAFLSAAATVQLPAAGARSRQRRSMALTLVLGTAVGGIAVAALLSTRPDLQALLRSALPPAPVASASAPVSPPSHLASSVTSPAILPLPAPSAAPAAPAKRATVATMPAPVPPSPAPTPPTSATSATATAVAITALPLESARPAPKATPKKAAASSNPQPPPPTTTKPSHDFGF
jgi:hypothetical protein